MLKYIVKRILYLIPILFGVSIIIFGLNICVGDPGKTDVRKQCVRKLGSGKKRRTD